MRPFVQLATVLSESQQAVRVNRYWQRWDAKQTPKTPAEQVWLMGGLASHLGRWLSREPPDIGAIAAERLLRSHHGPPRCEGQPRWGILPVRGPTESGRVAESRVWLGTVR
jgi:hypothetical protein